MRLQHAFVLVLTAVTVNKYHVHTFPLLIPKSISTIHIPSRAERYKYQIELDQILLSFRDNYTPSHKYGSTMFEVFAQRKSDEPAAKKGKRPVKSKSTRTTESSKLIKTDSSVSNKYSKNIDGDTDHQGMITSFDDYRDRLQVLAREADSTKLSSQRLLEISHRAQNLFDDMLNNFISEGKESLEPTIEIYNALVKIYASTPIDIAKDVDQHEHGHQDNNKGEDLGENGEDYSNEYTGIKMADLILRRMEEDNSLPSPDKDTYLYVMNGWFLRKQYAKLILIFDRLKKNMVHSHDTHVSPDTAMYNLVIRAWMKSGNDEAPENVQKILQHMLVSYESGQASARPNMDSFAYVMDTFVRARDKLCARKVKHLIHVMNDLRTKSDGYADLLVTTSIRNIEIKAIGQQRDKSAMSEIETILQEMIQDFRAGHVHLKPDGATFVNIINAMKASPIPDAALRASSLLTLVNELYDKGEIVRDDMLNRIYNAALATWARSRERGKAGKSKEILEQMKLLQASGKACFSPDIRSYNSVLNACAYSRGDEAERSAALRVAVTTFNELRELSNVQPNHVTYGTFLQVLGNLMDPTDSRDAIIEKVFRKCSNEGHVSVFVLQSFTDAASSELSSAVLGGNVESEEGVKIPEFWSRNCVLEHLD